MKRKKFFETYREAKTWLGKYREWGYRNTDSWEIWDLKKNFPRRIKTRYFVGSYFEWLNI